MNRAIPREQDAFFVSNEKVTLKSFNCSLRMTVDREATEERFLRTRLQHQTLFRNFVSLRLEGTGPSIVQNPQANFSDISFRTSYYSRLQLVERMRACY